MKIWKQAATVLLACALVIATCPLEGIALPAPPTQADTGQSPERLDQLVAPIALYPDALVAQILAGATFPTEIVEADRWLSQNSSLKGEALGKAVDAQPWDESVKALTQFPTVLADMSKNLSWTSSLGDAFFNDKDAVTAAVQELRAEAMKAGNLKTSKEQTVTTQEKIIVIQPANPQVVYVPVYNPTVVYGYPVAVYPGYSTAALATTAVIAFGIGVAVGAAVWGPCCRWGYSSWGYAWHGGGVTYNRNVYISNSNVYVNRNSYYKNQNNYPRPTPYNGNNNNVNRSGNSNVNRSGNTNNNRSGNTINKGDTNINRGGNTVNVNTGGNRTGNTSTPPAGNRGNVQGGQGQGQNRTNSNANTNANRGYGQTRDAGTKSSALSGQTTGGNAAAQQSRGRASTGATGGAAKSSGGAAKTGGNAGGKKR